jgi:hypothetical protein
MSPANQFSNSNKNGYIPVNDTNLGRSDHLLDEYKQDLCISGPSSTTPSWGRCHISKLFFDGK